jgi:hypothetical protein
MPYPPMMQWKKLGVVLFELESISRIFVSAEKFFFRL